MIKLAFAALLMFAIPACVLGRGPTARHAAMIVDGALVAGGIALVATADHSSSDFVGEVVAQTGNSLQKEAGAIVLLAGLAGLVVNLALEPSSHRDAAP